MYVCVVVECESNITRTKRKMHINRQSRTCVHVRKVREGGDRTKKNNTIVFYKKKSNK